MAIGFLAPNFLKHKQEDEINSLILEYLKLTQILTTIMNGNGNPYLSLFLYFFNVNYHPMKIKSLDKGHHTTYDLIKTLAWQ